MSRSACDNNVLFDVLSDACFSPAFTVADRPVVVRGFDLAEGERIIVEMVGGSSASGAFFEPVTRGCGCCTALSAKSNELVITVSGTYRLNRCSCTPSPASNAYVEWQTVDSGVTNFGSNEMSCACSEGSNVAVARNPDGSVTIVVDNVPTTIAAPAAPGAQVSATTQGDTLILTVDGVSHLLDLGPDTPEQVAALFALVDCAGQPIPARAAVATCADLAAQTAGSALAATLDFSSCGGAPHAVGAVIPTCAEMNTAISAAITAAVAALPSDKFLQGLSSYDAATNVLTLALSDGSTVPVNLSALLADAVASSTAAATVVITDAFGVPFGRIFPL